MLQSLIDENDISADRLEKEDQAARTTFNVSETAAQSLSWLAEHHRTTQKRILGHILQVLQEMKGDVTEGSSSLADAVQGKSAEETIRKPVAIDPKVRKELNSLSDELGVSRDRLVETGIRLGKLLAEKQLEKVGEDIEAVREYRRQGDQLQNQLSDPELQRGVGRAITILVDVVGEAENALESGRSIELPF